MTEMRKDAGQARQRPRPPATARAAEQAAGPTARPAGIAPVFDTETGQLKGREGPFKGMISNPLVRQWTQRAEEPREEERQTGPSPRPGEAPAAEPRRASSDAGPAPRPARDSQS
jgi:hypothetical protein